MSKNHRETIGQRWIKSIYTDKNKEQTESTSKEDKLKIDVEQDNGDYTDETTDRTIEDIFHNNSTDVCKCWKNEINDKVQDNATENENKIIHDTRKRKINLNKENENITKKSLLQEIFLSDIDNDKRKPLNLDCLVLKPEYVKKYKRLNETSLNRPSNKVTKMHFDTKESTCFAKSNNN